MNLYRLLKKINEQLNFMFTPATRVCYNHLNLLHKNQYFLLDEDNCRECIKNNDKTTEL